MKFTTKKKDLQAVLKLLAPAIGKKSYTEEVKCVRISASKEDVVFRATDYSIAAVVPLPGAKVALDGNGDTLVNHAQLAGVVATFDPESSIEFDGLARGKPLRIHAGAARVDLPVFNLDHFPSFPPDEMDGGLPLRIDDFAQMVKLASYAVTDQELLPPLTQLMYVHRGDTARLVSCDMHRLASAVVHTGLQVEDRQELMLPPYAAKLAGQMFASDEVEVGRTANLNHVVFAGRSGKRLAVNVKAGTYPDVDAVTPERGAGQTSTFSVSSLSRAARLVLATTESPHRMNLNFEGAQVTVTGGEDAKVLDILAVTGSDIEEGFETIFNARYLLDTLTRWPSEKVEVGLTHPERAARFDVPEEDFDGVDHFAMIMPLRAP